MMKLTVNGESIEYEGDAILMKLLEKLGYSLDQPIAVAINCEFVPRSEYSQYMIKEGDDIEIVAPMQGG